MVKSITQEDIERIAERYKEHDILGYADFNREWNSDFKKWPKIRDSEKIRTEVMENVENDIPRLRGRLIKGEIIKRKVMRGDKTIEIELKDFNYRGTIKGRIVKARLTYVTVKGNNVRRYRDALGRFTSVK